MNGRILFSELARMLEENIDGFSPRVWIVAVVVVLVVITVSGLYLLVDHCQHHRFGKSGKSFLEKYNVTLHSY